MCYVIQSITVSHCKNAVQILEKIRVEFSSAIRYYIRIRKGIFLGTSFRLVKEEKKHNGEVNPITGK